MKFATKIRLLSAGLIGALVLVPLLAMWQSRASQTGNALSYKAETLASRAGFSRPGCGRLR